MDRCALPPRSPSDDAPTRALAIAERFRSRYLRKFLHRLGTWKGFEVRRRPDLLDDLGQELCVIALEDATRLLALEPAAQRQHLLRALQRAYYRLEGRRARAEQSDPGVIARAPARRPTDALLEELRGESEVRTLLEAASFRGNGRIHTRRTATEMTTSPRRIRELLRHVAHTLGFDDDRERFWLRRLGETLLGEAAARLLDAGLPNVWHRDARRRHEPGAGHHRVQRILAAFDVRPQSPALRDSLRALQRISGTRFATWPPRRLLTLAADLLPDDPRVALWQFEDAAHRGQLGEASDALSRAQALGADGIRSTLARARLAELRGARASAERLLEEALAKHPRDARLRRSYAALQPAQAAPEKAPAVSDEPGHSAGTPRAPDLPSEVRPTAGSAAPAGRDEVLQGSGSRDSRSVSSASGDSRSRTSEQESGTATEGTGDPVPTDRPLRYAPSATRRRSTTCRSKRA